MINLESIKNWIQRVYRLIPLNLSDLLLKSSALTKIKVDIIIKQVATAIIVGLSCSLNPTHIWIGIVVFSRPAKNNTTTTSSKEVTKANNAPEITPGIINGNVIFINVFTGLLPKLAAARVTLWSKPVNVAVTVITTNGVPRIISVSYTHLTLPTNREV